MSNKLRLYYQSSLDSMCGIYSIVNAHKIVNRASDGECQLVFNNIIEYLAKKRKLKSVMLEGVFHRQMLSLIHDVMGDSFPTVFTNVKNFINLAEWWAYTKHFMDTSENPAVILSLAGKVYHLTTIAKMSEKQLFLHDSTDGEIKLPRRLCKLAGYPKEDRYIIYPTQCIYVSKDKAYE